MILERSTHYWAVGITLTWHPASVRDHDGNRVDGWSGEVDYYDDGFADDDPDTTKLSTQGTLRTRYIVADGKQQSAITAIVDTLITDAGRLGIKFRADGGLPWLYVPGDGEWEDKPVPDGWREMLAAEAERIGWATYSVKAR